MPELTPQFLTIGFIYYIVFLFSTTCHEASHALVAKWGGDSTAALNGQVTLNPIPTSVASFGAWSLSRSRLFYLWDR